MDASVNSQMGLPRSARLLILVLSAGVLISAVAGAGLAVLLPFFVEDQRTALALFGFEVVVCVAAALGVLMGRGRYQEAPATALACIGGTILVASVLGWQGAGRQLGGVSLMPFLAMRLLAAFALLGCAILHALSRNQRAWRLALLGGFLGLPVVLAAATVAHPRGWRMLERMIGDEVLVQAGVAVGALIVFGGLLAASVHLVIAAFDMAAGDAEGEADSSANKPS